MKKLIVTLVVLAVFAPAALASPHHFVKVSPSSAKPGNTVRVHGSAGTCVSSILFLISKAFKGATTHKFAGVPAIDAVLMGHGKFSVKVKLSKHLHKGTYSISGRCGGGLFGSAKLTVT
jgi:hypothetical protein